MGAQFVSRALASEPVATLLNWCQLVLIGDFKLIVDSQITDRTHFW